MALPLPANTTCDIYRFGVMPPAPPSVAGVACYLSAIYGQGIEQGESTASSFRYTHLLLVGPTVDIRDDYNAGAAGGAVDSVYIPDKNGTQWRVTFVERRDKGTATDHKRAYITRQGVTWPSNNL